MYVCETTCRCLSKLVSSADPGVQKECLGSGHLGLALPSVSQISFLTHKLSRAGNHMVAQLRSAAGVWSSVKAPQYNTAWSHTS